ncbi:MAG: hypothetical protein Q8P18_08785 [Pseudomonadota bacterium]|nr:hypothetical protein [Pseudomonadota bacterium]
MLLALLGMSVGVAAVGVGWVWPRLEWAEVDAPWTDPLPEHAIEDGYASFYRWRGGPVWRAWEESWLDRDPPRPEGPLLVDEVHASKQPWDADISMDTFGYSRMHGFARAFAPILAAGVEVEEVGWRWSGRRLAGASAVFVNLVSGDNAALRASEVVALEAFVRRGGGLVLITDHSNCYFHQELLAPLTGALGITLPPITAADPTNRLTPASVSWIRVFAASPGASGDHPVMAGVQAIGLMTAGAVEGLPALAVTSAESWRDRWEPYRKADSSGFTGNLERDVDEAPGPMAVVAAGTHGEGRVVVLADQNAWGATLIGYEDNARLFTNAVGWAMGRQLPPPVRGPDTVTTLMAPERSDCTSVEEEGFRTFQVQSQRWAARTGRGEGCTGRSVGASGGVILLPQGERADLDAVLAAPRVLVVLDPTAPITDAVLARLGLARGPVDADPPLAEARWVVERPAQDVPMLAIGSDRIEARPMAVTGPMDLWMTDTFGRPVVAVVRHGGTTVMLLLDADLLRNGALGLERADPRKGLPDGGSSRALAAHRLAHRLLAELYAP